MGLFGRSKQKDDTVEQLKFLFDKFEFADLETLCVDVIGRKPESKEERITKVEMLDYIWERYHEGKVNFSQVKEFAIRHGIVGQSFFD